MANKKSEILESTPFIPLSFPCAPSCGHGKTPNPRLGLELPDLDQSGMTPPRDQKERYSRIDPILDPILLLVDIAG